MPLNMVFPGPFCDVEQEHHSKEHGRGGSHICSECSACCEVTGTGDMRIHGQLQSFPRGLVCPVV